MGFFFGFYADEVINPNAGVNEPEILKKRASEPYVTVILNLQCRSKSQQQAKKQLTIDGFVRTKAVRKSRATTHC